MVECTGFENRHTRKGIGGSNPPASARLTRPSPKPMQVELLNYLPYIVLALFIIGVGVFGYLLFDLRRRFFLLFDARVPESSAELTVDILKRVEITEAEIAAVKPRIATLEGIARISFQKIGFIRFNPFADTGGDQSFALCLLDADDNGFVISSLYGREGTRMYAKAVERGVPKQVISDEEKAVLEHAMHGN